MIWERAKLNIPNRFILGTQSNLHIINVNTKDFCVQYENSSNIFRMKKENLRKLRMNRSLHIQVILTIINAHLFIRKVAEISHYIIEVFYILRNYELV